MKNKLESALYIIGIILLVILIFVGHYIGKLIWIEVLQHEGVRTVHIIH